MIKKIFVGIILAAIFGLLILGAVNRTLAKSSESGLLAINQSLSAGNGGGNGNISPHQDHEITTHEYAEDGRPHGESVEIPPNQTENTLDNNGIDNRYGAGWLTDLSRLGQAEVVAWVQATGVVASRSTNECIIKLTDGTDLNIEGRSHSYLIEQGFAITMGDTLNLTVFFDGIKFEVGQIQNITTGETIRVREENGRPLWAGNRRGTQGH